MWDRWIAGRQDRVPKGAPFVVKIADPPDATFDDARFDHGRTGIADDVGPGLRLHSKPGGVELRQPQLQPSRIRRHVARRQAERIGHARQTGDQIALAGRGKITALHEIFHEFGEARRGREKERAVEGNGEVERHRESLSLVIFGLGWTRVDTRSDSGTP
ncbi:hypothetical protein [Palleronia aestuarii]|uniref:hypothetical protein n=1 Tax=Palleronia aestuarii TaxID=568105 RepID=UPI000DAE5322|nr:hypothetical protein [Palleronia aestuarii]